jgi:hypothetical protein
MWVRPVLAAAVAAAAGLVVVFVLPRGPITAPQALATLLVGLMVGCR